MDILSTLQGFERLRRERRISRLEIARHSGVSPRRQSNYVAGRIVPREATVMRLLEAAETAPAPEPDARTWSLARNVLMYSAQVEPEETAAMTDEELLRLRHFGPKALAALRRRYPAAT